MSDEIKLAHGGERPGAGRKVRNEKVASKKKTVRMTPEELSESMELLRGNETWSDMVRRLIKRTATIERELKRRRQVQGGQEETQRSGA